MSAHLDLDDAIVIPLDGGIARRSLNNPARRDSINLVKVSACADPTLIVRSRTGSGSL
jgi:hypothetical protein